MDDRATPGRNWRMGRALAVLLLASGIAHGQSEPDRDAAERGRLALTGKNFNPAVWSLGAYDNAWRHWNGTKTKPEDYDTAFRHHYGLHPAPYPNHGLPMGLRQG